MWAFFDFGLLMPAIVPAKYANTPAVLAWTNNGEYELQVRARLREHLERFIELYMDEGTYNPIIQATPDKDYNYRFYTTREAYAEGIKRAALAIDYEKFKDSSERFPDHKEYHSLLNSIWARTCDLNTPGGIWGPRSSSNPTGYTNASRYSGWGGGWQEREDWHDEYYGSGRRIGDSFRNIQVGTNRDGSPQFIQDYDTEGDAYDDNLERWDEMDWEPENIARARDLISMLEACGIEWKDWLDFVDEEQWILLKPEFDRRYEDEQDRLQREAERLERAEVERELEEARAERQQAKDRRRFKKMRRQGKKTVYTARKKTRR